MLSPKNRNGSVWAKTQETVRPRDEKEQQIALRRLGSKPARLEKVVLDD